MADDSLKCLKQIARNTQPKSSFQLIVSSNKTEFMTKYDSSISLDPNSKYEIALVNLETYYSFPNVHSANNVFKYSADNGRT